VELAPRRISLSNVDTDDPWLRVMRRVAVKRGYRLVERPAQRSPYIAINSEWSEFEKRLSGNLRQGMLRKRKRLEQEGEVAIETHTATTDLESLLIEGFEIESSEWKAVAGTAIGSDPRTRRFYSDVATWAAAKKWLRLVFLRVSGRPIAFRFDLESNGVLYHLKGGYDPEFSRFSPGNLLARESLQYAFSSALARYEFLGADQPHKLQWTNTCHDQVLFEAFAPSVGGGLDHAYETRAKPIARVAKRTMRRLRDRSH
jgi:CelD/BcsL family acetyltransferase involved in cellulose biosynthesis